MNSFTAINNLFLGRRRAGVATPKFLKALRLYHLNQRTRSAVSFISRFKNFEQFVPKFYWCIAGPQNVCTDPKFFFPWRRQHKNCRNSLYKGTQILASDILLILDLFCFYYVLLLHSWTSKCFHWTKGFSPLKKAASKLLKFTLQSQPNFFVWYFTKTWIYSVFIMFYWCTAGPQNVCTEPKVFSPWRRQHQNCWNLLYKPTQILASDILLNPVSTL